MTQTSTEVEEVDPIEEAKIFASYGHFDKAAEILHWYLQGTPKDSGTFNQLLSLYINMEDEKQYVDLIQSYAKHYDGSLIVSNAIVNGLTYFPANKALRDLAASLPAIDVSRLDELDDLAGTGGDHPAAEEAQTSANIIPLFSDKGDKNAPDDGPDRRPAPEAALPLVDFHPFLSDLSRAEELTLHGFVAGDDVGALRLGLPGIKLKARELEWQVALDQSSVSAHVELLTRYYEIGALEQYSRILWRLFCLLENKGHTLRRRMLDYGLRLGKNRVLNGLTKALDSDMSLESLAGGLGLAVVYPPSKAVALVVAEDPGIKSRQHTKRNGEERVIADATAMIKRGELNEAMEMLEAALLNHPEMDALYPVLLEIYVSTGNEKRFSSFENRILGGDDQPSLESIMKVIDTGKNIFHQLKTVP